jgi:hypothetical protein
VPKTLAMIRQALREEGMSHTRVFEWKCANSMRLEKVTQMKSKVKNMLITL